MTYERLNIRTQDLGLSNTTTHNGQHQVYLSTLDGSCHRQRARREIGLFRQSNKCTDLLDDTDAGRFVKTLCDGGAEGICLGIGIVTGAAGAHLSTQHVLILGFSGLTALSIGLGINEFLSYKAQNIFLLNEFAASKNALLKTRQNELSEIIFEMVERGVERTDAQTVTELLSKYENFFLEYMYMPLKRQHLMPPTEELLQIKPLISEAFSTFLAVLVVGTLPLLGSLVAYSGDEERENLAFTVFYLMAGAILFTLGALKSYFYGVSWYSAGFEQLSVGVACGIAGFGAGAGVSSRAYVQS